MLNLMRTSSQPSSVQIMKDQAQLENVEYFSYLGSMIKKSARCTESLTSSTVIANTAFNRKQNLCTTRFDLNWRKEIVKCHTWSIALCGPEIWTLWKSDKKYLGSFKMWFWRRMVKIRWTDRVRNEEVLERVKEERNILQTIKGWKEG